MRAALALAMVLAGGPAAAHNGHLHPDPAEPLAAAPAGPAAPLPGRIGGPYALIDQHEALRTQVDPAGHPQLVFFGYANCPGICSSVLPTLAALTDRLAAAGTTITPILITVDPTHDTPAALTAAAPAIHPALVALTGSEPALAAARDAFQVESELIFEHPEFGPIYAHGSFIYLLDAQGRFLTLLPPILSPERMAEIVLSYL